MRPQARLASAGGSLNLAVTAMQKVEVGSLSRGQKVTPKTALIGQDHAQSLVQGPGQGHAQAVTDPDQGQNPNLGHVPEVSPDLAVKKRSLDQKRARHTGLMQALTRRPATERTNLMVKGPGIVTTKDLVLMQRSGNLVQIVSDVPPRLDLKPKYVFEVYFIPLLFFVQIRMVFS